MSEGILCFTAALCIAIQTLLTQAADQRTSRHKYISSWVLVVARGIDSDICSPSPTFYRGSKSRILSVLVSTWINLSEI